MKKIFAIVMLCCLIVCSGCRGNNGNVKDSAASPVDAQTENSAAEPSPEAFYVTVQAEGKPITDAAVSLLNLTSCAVWRGKTDLEGAVFPETEVGRCYRLHVEAPGYKGQTMLLEPAQVTGGYVTITLEPTAAECWYMAVECVTAEDDTNGEHQILLLASGDGASWQLVEEAPAMTGSSPDIEWDGEDLLLVLGNGDSVCGQKHVRVMRYDGSSGVWMGPAAAGTWAEGVGDYSMGVFDYSCLNRETALFRTADGHIRAVGLGQPNGSFDDLELQNPNDRTEVYDFVCGLADFAEGYDGSLLNDDRTGTSIS
jgi:hypothetical protein